MVAYNKPIPDPEQYITKPFWDGCAQGTLLYQHCNSCGHGQFYPRASCMSCGKRDLAWRTSNGRGVVHAMTQVHVGLPAFKDEAPYDIVLVTMTEGFRIMMNVTGGRDRLAIGRSGHVVFESRSEMKLPQFRLDPD